MGDEIQPAETPSPTLMESLANDVLEARLHKEAQDVTVNELRAAWEAAHEPELTAQRMARAAVVEAEEALRAAAIALHGINQDKHPGPGVEIKTYATLDYSFEDALAWAKKSDMALTLDRSAFEQIAKATRISFVRYGEQPKAQLASDMGKALGKEAS